MAEKLVCALLQGEAGTSTIERIAKSYKNCPYIDFMATTRTELFATFFLPEAQKWWIEYVEKKPKETFGLEKATVTFMDVIHYPKRLKMRLPKKRGKISPCGADCSSDPIYKKCLGCPATVYYKPKRQLAAE